MADSPAKPVYRSLLAVSYLLMALFACLLLMSVSMAVLGFAYVFFHRDHFSPEESGALSIVFYLMAFFVNLEPVPTIITVIVMLVWTYMAYANLPALKARQLEATPGWAVGYWLIPVVNLLKPFQIMREIWHGSDPEIKENNLFYRNKAGTPEIIGFWWGLFIVSGFAIRISNVMAGNGTTSESIFFPTMLVLSQLLRAGAALLIILIIREIKRRQDERFQRFAGRAEDAVPPPPPDFAAIDEDNEPELRESEDKFE